jgi:signal transduction histidine kinase
VEDRIEGVVITLVDVTALKKTEAALRESEARLERRVADRTSERDELRRALTLAEEAERRRLARELHDEAGQRLTALGLGLQALSDVVPAGSEADRHAVQLRSLADSLARELHALAVRLRPKALDDFGLEAALGAYAEEWSAQCGIAVDVHATTATERLSPEIESALYRIVQEALANVAKHSGARRASVIVERREGNVVAVIEDDGQGFDARAVERRGAALQGDGSPMLGLLGIRERAALLGGKVEVESTPGKGTTLFVRIPIVSSIPAISEDDGL